MNGAVKTAAVLVTLALGTPCGVNGQELEIGIIDVYGLSRVSVRQVREMLTFTEGDTIAFGVGEEPAFLKESEDRLARSPDIARARIQRVCCDAGRAIVYVGIEEPGAATHNPAGSRAARILVAAMRHSRASRSTSSEFAPFASPNRHAVSNTKTHARADRRGAKTAAN